MQVSRTLRFLSLPAALGLGTALAVACSDGAATAPDLTPSFGKKKHEPSQFDTTQLAGCVSGYNLTSVNPGSGADDDGDGYICKKGALKK